mmetsp:Transcript_5533/g.13429  ORF Transcript_5533/g.13429 Transcript_5533/m.13429 type:complete len:302 (+) Transcript_5533:297-1202(+)
MRQRKRGRRGLPWTPQRVTSEWWLAAQAMPLQEAPARGTRAPTPRHPPPTHSPPPAVGHTGQQGPARASLGGLLQLLDGLVLLGLALPELEGEDAIAARLHHPHAGGCLEQEDAAEHGRLRLLLGVKVARGDVVVGVRQGDEQHREEEGDEEEKLVVAEGGGGCRRLLGALAPLLAALAVRLLLAHREHDGAPLVPAEDVEGGVHLDPGEHDEAGAHEDVVRHGLARRQQRGAVDKGPHACDGDEDEGDAVVVDVEEGGPGGEGDEARGDEDDADAEDHEGKDGAHELEEVVIGGHDGDGL